MFKYWVYWVGHTMIYELECGKKSRKKAPWLIVLFKGHYIRRGICNSKLIMKVFNIRRCFGASGILCTAGVAYYDKPFFVINLGNLHLESIIHGWA